VIRFDPSGGGVAYIARLLRSALADAGHRPHSIELDARRLDSVAPVERLRFGARVLTANVDPRIDWLMFGHPGIADAQRFVPSAVRKPFAVQLHGVEAWEGALAPAVGMATLRIAPSRYTARRALEAHPTLGPIALCPHGLLPDGADGDPGRVDDALLARVHSRSALIVGRLWSSERRKGHDQLLECWPLVRLAIPDAQLVIAGSGDDLGRYREKVAALGIGDAVIFGGYVTRATMDALMDRVAVFAMPSRQEGFGLVYLEAMRHGIPCLGATDDAADEPIVHGETGLLIEQTDPGALARGLVDLIGIPELARRLGAAGQRRYLAEFTFERYRERLLALLAQHFPRRRR
jgi:phosphatidylinositol alpha-1,6-mannosyltransferase